jgi:hypothetical protein
LRAKEQRNLAQEGIKAEDKGTQGENGRAFFVSRFSHRRKGSVDHNMDRVRLLTVLLQVEIRPKDSQFSLVPGRADLSSQSLHEAVYQWPDLVLERHLPVPEIGQQQLPYMFNINQKISVKHRTILIVPVFQMHQRTGEVAILSCRYLLLDSHFEVML